MSHANRFIFVHIPKCAGESITHALLPTLGPEDVVLCEPVVSRRGRDGDLIDRHGLTKHARYSRIRSAYGAAVDDYLSFCFVRNPWDRAVSYFHYLGGENFREWAHTGRPTVSCTEFSDGVALVGRFENLPEEFDQVCAQLGLVARLPFVNRTVRQPYEQYFDAETREAVARRFATDISRWGYHF
ncbi:MAG: sulfotransferase family protein [bacterium]|nr:sulfotransferase family protein [bacterium]